MLYEIRKTTQRLGSVRLVTREELDSLTGFRSVYGFCEEAINHIRLTNTTANLRAMELYSDILLVDFDDQPEAADRFYKFLRNGADSGSAKSIKFEVYDSGGRSVHFHIYIKPMRGISIPESQREWMKKVAPKADISIYKTSGMYRLPGTFHHKNRGRYKKLISSYEGNLLEIPIVEYKPYLPISVKGVMTDDLDLENILMRLLLTPVVEGTKGRNNVAFQIAAICKDLDIGVLECTSLLHNWNITCSRPPLQITGIQSTINSAYRSYK